MKKTFAVLWISLLFSALHAQDLKLGLVAMPHISFLTSDDRISEQNGILPGFGFGLAGNYYFADHYGFSFGLNINTFTGGKLKYNETVSFKTADGLVSLPQGTTVTYKLQYLEIPLGLKLNTNRIGYMSYYGQFGFQPAVKLNAKGKSEAFPNSKIDDEVRWFNLMYYIGAGLEYYLGGSEKSSALTFGVIYKKGINDITKENGGRRTDKVLMSHLVLQAGIIF